MSAQGQDNVVGAIIFFSYIVAALVLTGILCNDVQKAFSNRQKKKQQTLQDQKAQTSLSAALATLSFAVLSYHMLSFLIQSYQTWSTGSVPSSGPQATFDAFRYALGNLLPSDIWAWAINSTLFRDFAEVICNDSNHFWWTQAALLYSYAWNVYMSIQGARKKIPHLWAYFLLDQILPVSFTQNMFLLSMMLHGGQEPAQDLRPVAPLLQSAASLLYLVTLRAAPSNVGGRYFFPVLFATRILLFAPYLLLQPARVGSWRVQRTPSKDLMHRYTWSFVTLGVGGVLLQISQTLRTKGLSGILGALNGNPAVSALAYDFLIGVVSIASFVGVRNQTNSFVA